MAEPRSGRWLFALAAIALLALAVRVTYVRTHTPHRVDKISDASYYHEGANLLVAGDGFINPLWYLIDGRHIAGADHPPGFTVALSVASLVGFKSFSSHQLWCAILSTGTVVVVGLVGRRLAGSRAGLIAAGLAAVYPNFFFSDGLLLSESLVLLMIAITLLAGYRYWDRPSVGRAVCLGIVCGLTALTRSEAVMLVPLLAVPLALTAPRVGGPSRFRLAALMVVAAAVTITPWIAYNVSRFQKPVFLSTPDSTLLAGNCRDTYYTDIVGYWSVGCVVRVTPVRIPKHGDLSTVAAVQRKAALHFIGANLDRLPFVIFAREGRTFGFYRPSQQLRLDTFASRELDLNRIALGMYYVMLPLFVVGIVRLRRRRVPVFPLFAVVVMVVIPVALFIGETRYRAAAEVPLVLGAGVGVDVLIEGLRGRMSHRPRASGHEPDVAAVLGTPEGG